VAGPMDEQLPLLLELAHRVRLGRGQAQHPGGVVGKRRVGEEHPRRHRLEKLGGGVEDVAGRQEEVAEELGEMSEEGTEEGDPLGDLSAFAEEARRLAEALQQGRLDPEVLRRQEQLFHRLLDAGRTLERDEESEERESEEPGDFDREGVNALTAGDIDALRFELPGAAALRALPPAQRALVLRYFERLNRMTTAGRSGPPGGEPR